MATELDNPHPTAETIDTLLMSAFAVLALLLASVGAYAMFASMAAARERELGIRMALDSGAGAIAALLLQPAIGWMGAGLIGGALGAIAIVRLLRRAIDRLPAFDPFAFGAAIATPIGCATMACDIHVRRAARVDTIAALRAE
jgi:putative ABC transport system permease protein